MTGSRFIEAAEALLCPLSELQKERFLRLDALYRSWNEKINVISRKDIDGLYLHHVLHSLAVAMYMKNFLPEVYGSALSPTEATDGSEPLTFLDCGTGGGFPGIPLAILFEGAKFTLCDSVGKKITVASDIAAQLGLGNVTTVNARIESLPGTYDYVVSRAVTTLEQFYRWVGKKYRRGVFYLKGGDIAEEIATMMGRFKLRRCSVHTWDIESCLNDPYFNEKFVIFIENFCK